MRRMGTLTGSVLHGTTEGTGIGVAEKYIYHGRWVIPYWR